MTRHDETLGPAIRNAALAGTAAFLLAASPGGAASAKDAPPTPIEFYASISVKPEAMDRFLVVMRTNARASREEAGNVSFDVYRREDGGNELLLMERWADEAAVEAHGQTPHLQAVVGRERPRHCVGDGEGTGGQARLRAVAAPMSGGAFARLGDPMPTFGQELRKLRY